MPLEFSLPAITCQLVPVYASVLSQKMRCKKYFDSILRPFLPFGDFENFWKFKIGPDLLVYFFT